MYLLLDGARNTKIVKSTLGNFRKYSGHWISSLLIIHGGETKNLETIGRELSTQELVNQDDLEGDIDDVDHLTDDISSTIDTVPPVIVIEILTNCSAMFVFDIF